MLGQSEVPPGIMESTVLIQLENGSSGSGFIVVDTVNKNCFLITAKHVLFSEFSDNKNSYMKLNATKGEILSYPHNYNKSVPNTIFIDLDGLFKTGI